MIRVSLRSGDEAHWIGIEARGPAWRVTLSDGSHRVDDVQVYADRIEATIDGIRADASLSRDADRIVVLRQGLRHEFVEDAGAEHRASVELEGHLRAPMPGHVLDVRVAKGQQVSKGTVLIVLEAMKMEHSLTAPWNATVDQVAVQTGARVEEGADLVQLIPLAQPSGATGPA